MNGFIHTKIYVRDRKHRHTLTVKFFDSIMTGQLNQVSSIARESNKLSDDDEPDLQQILIEEARQRRLNKKRLLKLKQAKLRYKQKLRLLKEFKKSHTDFAGHPNSAILLDINKKYVVCPYYFSVFVLSESSPKSKELHGIK